MNAAMELNVERSLTRQAEEEIMRLLQEVTK